MTSSLPSVQRSKSLHEQIYQTLRASILSGEIAPGERLVETQIAERLQVSRTPVREAMRQLQRDTLLTADGSGGLRVAIISIADVMQLYDCRIALEQLSVQQACQNITPVQLQAIEALVMQAEDLLQQPPSRQRSGQMLDLDYRFHRSIAESSGNRWLVTLLDQVFDKMALLRGQTAYHNPQVLEIRSEHRQVWESIVQRNIEAAVAAIEAHLLASKSRVVQEVKSIEQE